MSTSHNTSFHHGFISSFILWAIIEITGIGGSTLAEMKWWTILWVGIGFAFYFGMRWISKWVQK